jgi:tight adherence protein C
MSLLFIAIIVYAGIFSLVYQIYLDRKKRVSLGIVADAGSQGKPLPKEGSLRKLLKAFAFLGEIKAIRYVIGRAVPSRLVMAGSPLNIIEFSIMKTLSMVIFTVLSGVITGRSDKLAISVIIGLAVGFVVPEFWLGARIKRRHREIRHDLPLVIDLLNLCVEAGLDFMLAVNRVMRDFKKCALLDELSEVWRETKMGASRRESLQHMSSRVNLIELSSFVRTLLQADRMGSPMGEALKIQAEEIRQRRYLQGEEAALKAPIKLLFPLFVFILPVVLVIVAGPILIQFLRGGGIKF